MFALLLLAAAPSSSLTDCMTAHLVDADKPVLARWYALEIAASPAAEGTQVDAAKREAADKEAASVFTRLVTKDCATVAKPLFAADSQNSFREAGVAISRLAAREMLASEGVNRAIVRSYVSHLKREDFAGLMP